MYTARITNRITGKPAIQTADVEHVVSCIGGPNPEFEEIDAAEGIWMISLMPFLERGLLNSGSGEYYTRNSAGTDGCVVQIELP